MKESSNYKLFSIILLLTISFIASSKVISQSTISMSENSNSKILDKEPILEAKLVESEIQSGNPIELTLTIKNETDFTIVLFDVAPERSFDITVKDSEELSLPLTNEGVKRKYPNNIVRRETVYLEPGKELSLSKIRLDELFDLKRADSYTLTVTRTYYFQDIFDKDTGMEKVGILASKLKFNISQNYPQSNSILTKDYNIAKKALEKAVREKDLNAIRLGLKGFSFQIRKDVVEEIVKLNDKSFVPDLADALEENQGCLSGGSETEVLQKELNNLIVSAIKRLTGLEFSYFDSSSSQPCSNDFPPKDIQRILKESRDWWKENKKDYQSENQ